MERKPTVAEISPDKSSSPIEFTGSSVKPLSTQIKENSFFQSKNGSSEKQLPNENEVPDQQFKDESRSPVGAEEVQVGIFPESEVIKKASDLSCEKKMLQSHIKNLQEHVSAVEEQLEQKQGQCEMVNSQLKDKEKRLKEALEYISALEELMRINDGRHSSALKKACSDHDSVKKELESCTNECIGYLNQLLEAQADGKAIEKDKLELEENVNVTIGALQVEIQQLKLNLETSSAELSAAGEKALQFQEENEVLRSQLDSLKEYLKDSEENLRLDLTKIQQELDSERAEHTATEILAEEMLSGTKNALEFQVNKLQENLGVVERQNESIKQELNSERSAHSETKSHLELCQNQLEEGRNRYLLELSKVQNTVNILKAEKNALQSEVDEFQANLFAASSRNESLKKGVGVDEEDPLSDGPSKKARLLDQSSSSICLAPQAKLIRGSENYSSVIEVDVGGPDNEMFSRASSFGSLIPKSRPPKRKREGQKELFKLLNDECKELRRKGLEDLSFIPIFHSNHRVTRCRPKSQPLMSGHTGSWMP